MRARSTSPDGHNPRDTNRHGHVLELTEDGDDPTATTFTWTLLLVCGNPADPATYFAGFPKDQVSPISCPDNLAFDPSGNLWIATDGNALGSNDGLFAVPLDGPSRGHVKQFLTAPRGAEACGPVIEDRLVLVSGFLRALGLAEPEIPLEVDERAAAYRSLLTGRRVLVVLDNAATVEQVRPLLSGTASCSVVVTSRDSLAGLVARHGARRLELDPLPPEDAVVLLRALIGERIDAEPEAAATLAQQCVRLPLALRVAAELAAAARPDASLAELVTELGDEHRLLELLDAGGDPRTAVRGVLSWSYRHLPADAARMFRLIGLYPGPDLDLYAAAVLADVSLDRARHLLDLLVRAHLIQLTRSRRHGMHDLLRAYATSLAAEEDPEQQRRAALTALFREINHRIGEARTLAILGDVYQRQGHYGQADEHQRQALALYREISHPAGEARALNNLGEIRRVTGQLREALIQHTAALTLATRIGDRYEQARAHHGLAHTHLTSSDSDLARHHWQQALAHYTDLGIPDAEDIRTHLATLDRAADNDSDSDSDSDSDH